MNYYICMQTTIYIDAPAVYRNPSKKEKLKNRLDDCYECKPTISSNLSEVT